jgi:hypothetical protein
MIVATICSGSGDIYHWRIIFIDDDETVAMIVETILVAVAMLASKTTTIQRSKRSNGRRRRERNENQSPYHKTRYWQDTPNRCVIATLRALDNKSKQDLDASLAL